MKFRYEVYHGPFPCQPQYFTNYKEVSRFIKEQLNAGTYIQSVKKVDSVSVKVGLLSKPSSFKF